MNYHRENSSGYRETGVARYTWKDGNLETVVSDVFHTNNLYERHEIYTFGYDMQDSLKLNPGIYLQEMNCFPGLYDFIWYAGLGGKPPVAFRRRSHTKRWETEKIAAKRNLSLLSSGRKRMLRYCLTVEFRAFHSITFPSVAPERWSRCRPRLVTGPF